MQPIDLFWKKMSCAQPNSLCTYPPNTTKYNTIIYNPKPTVRSIPELSPSAGWGFGWRATISFHVKYIVVWVVSWPSPVCGFLCVSGYRFQVGYGSFSLSDLLLNGLKSWLQDVLISWRLILFCLCGSASYTRSMPMQCIIVDRAFWYFTSTYSVFPTDDSYFMGETSLPCSLPDPYLGLPPGHWLGRLVVVQFIFW